MSDGMGRELAYLSSHATNRYFIPNWGNTCSSTRALPGSSDSCRSSTDKTMMTLSWQYRLLVLLWDAMDSEKIRVGRNSLSRKRTSSNTAPTERMLSIPSTSVVRSSRRLIFRMSMWMLMGWCKMYLKWCFSN